MEFMELIKGIAEKISGELIKAYPENCTVSLYCHSDGYISLKMTEWEANDGKKVDDLQRRELLDIYKIGDWAIDRSDDQNKYYATLGVLKEG